METTDKINISALSIGDWVQARMTKWDYDDLDITPPMRVVKIEKDGVVLSLGGIEHPAFVDDLQPIPITPEILEKNGFVFNSEYDYKKRIVKNWICRKGSLGMRFWADGSRSQFSIDNDTWGNWVAIKKTNRKPIYIHELQRFLQLANVDKDIEV